MKKYKRKFKWKKNSKLKRWFLLIFVFLASMSIGYSALNDTLQINGTVTAIPLQITGSYMVVFDPNSGQGTMNPQTIDVGDTVNLTPNAFTNGGYSFSHWNTAFDGSGTDYNDGQAVKDIASDGQTITLYAQWAYDVARIGSTYYSSLQAAINAVPTTDAQTVVELLVDTSENLTVAQHQNIVFDLNNHTVTNGNGQAVLTNNGTVVINDGTLRSSSTANGAVNNNSTGTLTINGGSIYMDATGGKQAIYNDGGVVEISGTAYIQSNSRDNQNNKRAAVHNKAGTMRILGGTIVSPSYIALKNEANMVIGVKDGSYDVSSPVIQGYKYGIEATADIQYYDGIIKGKTKAIDNEAKIIDIEVDYAIVHGSETIGGTPYDTAYQMIAPVTVTFDPCGGIVNEASRLVSRDTAVGTLPTQVARAGYAFEGWYTLADGGTQVTSSTIVTADVTFFAHWRKIKSAIMDGVEYDTLQDAINAVPRTGESKTIALLRDISEDVTISSGKKIVFDFGNHTLSAVSVAAVENSGDLSFVSGTITSNTETAAVNNRNGGRFTMSGQSIIATGTRQAVFNFTGGYIEITGNSYLSSTTTGEGNVDHYILQRGTAHNQPGATMVITGGTIECSTQHAISNAGNLTIGVKDGSIDTTTPTMTGALKGIYSTTAFNFYDGTAKGGVAAIDGTIGDQETNSQIVDSTEVIGSTTYYTEYLEIPAQP